MPEKNFQEIKVQTIEPVYKKDGTEVEGKSQYGKWKLWRINKEYKFFGEPEKPDWEDKTIVARIELDDYGDKMIKEPREIIRGDEGEIVDGDTLIMDEIQKINDRLDKMSKYLKEQFDNIEHQINK